MSIKPRFYSREASALLMTLVMTGAALLIVISMLAWTSSNTRFSGRHSQYYRTLAAAEAATEKVIARVGNDYQNSGIPLVVNNLDSYRKTVPTTNESGYWSNYEFTDESGVHNQISVDWFATSDSPILSSKYKGLRGFAYDMRIVCKARELSSPYQIVARNRQSLELALVAVFQYAVFFNVDLEICPSPPMTLTGPVHCNGNLYLSPANSLVFQDEVTTAGLIIFTRKPIDPSTPGTGTVTFNDKHTEKVLSLNLPVGTTNSPAAVHQIIEIPPWTESPTSLVGQQRYYNKADLVILVSDTGLAVTSGSSNGFATTIPIAQAKVFINTNASFSNAREGKTIKCVDIDVGKFREWNRTNDVLGQWFVKTIFVGDTRTIPSGTEPGVRLTNGAWLPPYGLTVATHSPMYIVGNYNVTTNGTPVNLGTANTTATVPASIAADAITILSTAWTDGNSANATRTAANTTVNCAILAGNVTTTATAYSGGLENFPRFLENWSGITFTYNGSMVAMFDSRVANVPWGGSGVYSPPIRNWAFDENFNDITKIPPASPQVRLLLRGTWSD